MSALHPVSKSFITAGSAIFTVVSRTGERYTYRVTRKDPDPRVLRLASFASHASGRLGYTDPAWFVGLLTGPNNEADYTYLGMLKPETGEVRLTRRSAYGESAKPVRVVAWALRLVWAGAALPEGYCIHHEGRCGRCGRLLTVPESIVLGIGPDCAEKMGLKAA